MESESLVFTGLEIPRDYLFKKEEIKYVEKVIGNRAERGNGS